MDCADAGCVGMTSLVYSGAIRGYPHCLSLRSPESINNQEGIALCKDGIDNDGNGRADCRDTNCLGPNSPCTVSCDNREGITNPATCFDRIDNDNDGFIDCNDAACEFVIYRNNAPCRGHSLS